MKRVVIVVSRHVSIRSPHRSEGRRASEIHSHSATEFQSAPLTEARGDLSLSNSIGIVKWFQSAPLTEARGDLLIRGELGLQNVFQSAPLTEARGDRQGKRHRYPDQVVSIRSPHRSEGRLY